MNESGSPFTVMVRTLSVDLFGSETWTIRAAFDAHNFREASEIKQREESRLFDPTDRVVIVNNRENGEGD
jgi:hypothetical protein